MTIGVSAYHETHDQLHNDQEIGDPEIPSLTTLADSQEKDVHSHEEGELSQSTSGCETSGSNHCEDGDHEQHERQGSATPSLEWPSAQQTSEGQQVDGLPGGSAQQTSEGQQVDGLPGGSALPGKRITRRQTLRKKTSAAQAAQAAQGNNVQRGRTRTRGGQPYKKPKTRRQSKSKKSGAGVHFDEGPECEEREEVFEPAKEVPSLWEVCQNPKEARPERQLLNNRLDYIVAMIGSACADILKAEKAGVRDHEVFKLLDKITGQEDPSKDFMANHGLEELALRCSKAEEVKSAADFSYTLCSVQFRSKFIM